MKENFRQQAEQFFSNQLRRWREFLQHRRDSNLHKKEKEQPPSEVLPYTFDEVRVRQEIDTLSPTGKEPLTQTEKDIIVHNVRTFFYAYIGTGDREDSAGIGTETRSVEKDFDDPQGRAMIREPLRATYDSDNGKIGHRSNHTLEGQYSIFRTYVLRRREELVKTEKGWETDWSLKPSYTIETEYPPEGINPVTLTQAIQSGLIEKDDGSFVPAVDPEPLSDLTIRPERLWPDMEPNQIGEYVVDLRKLTPEDRLVLTSMKIFNQIYGEPPKN